MNLGGCLENGHQQPNRYTYDEKGKNADTGNQEKADEKTDKKADEKAE